MKIKSVLVIAALLSAAGFGIYGVIFARSAGSTLITTERELDALRKASVRSEEQFVILQDQVATLQKQMAALQSLAQKNNPNRRSAVELGPASVGATANPPSGTRPLIMDEKSRKALLDSKHRRYDAFLREQNLTPEQRERFLNLLIEQDNIRTDLQNAIREQGIAGDNAAVEKLRAQFYQPITREMREILGNDGYIAFGGYEKSSFFRIAHVEPLLPQFQAAQAPLSETQITSLAAIIMASNPQQDRRNSPSDISPASRVDWEAVAQQASQILSPAQMQVLQTRVRTPAPSVPKK